MSHYISLQHVLGDLQDIALDDNVFDAANVTRIGSHPFHPVNEGMTTDEKAMVGVR